MKKNFFRPVAIAAVIGSLAIFSCKKSDDGVSRHDQLVGSWLSIQEGLDSNNNGAFDNNEKMTIATADQYTVKFNTDGSGTETGLVGSVPTTIPFTWNLQNSDNDVRIIGNFFGTIDTAVSTITSLSGTDLLIKDNSSTPASFTAMKKQ